MSPPTFPFSIRTFRVVRCDTPFRRWKSCHFRRSNNRRNSASLVATHRLQRGGFSLIELLAVISIIVLLGASTLPALQRLAEARNLARAGADIVSTLEFARTEAIAKNTFVWVGFSGPDGESDQKLHLAVVASRDGTSDPDASNLRSLAPILKIRNAQVATEGSAQEKAQSTVEVMRKLADGQQILNPIAVGHGHEGIQFKQGGENFSNTITFTPQGEVSLSGRPDRNTVISPFLGFYVQRTHGEAPGANLVAILINGLSGRVRLVEQQ